MTSDYYFPFFPLAIARPPDPITDYIIGSMFPPRPRGWHWSQSDLGMDILYRSDAQIGTIVRSRIGRRRLWTVRFGRRIIGRFRRRRGAKCCLQEAAHKKWGHWDAQRSNASSISDDGGRMGEPK
jgi:hypothetical protein